MFKFLQRGNKGRESQKKDLFGFHAVTLLVGACSLSLIYILMTYMCVGNFVSFLKQQDIVQEFQVKGNHLFQDTETFKELMTVVDFHHIKIKHQNECAERKLLVYTCNHICGGWGDRQNGLITSFLLALVSNRTFVIDMNSPCKLEDVMESNLYDWMACKPYLGNVSEKETTIVNKIDSKTLSSDILRPDFVTYGTQRVIRLRTNVRILHTIRQHKDTSKNMKWIINMPNETVVKLVLKILFKNEANMQNQLDTFIGNTVIDRTLVCAHVRKGQNPTIPKDETFIGNRGVPNELTIFSFLQKYSDEKRYRVYVASDSENVKRKAAEIFPNFISTNKTILHVDRFDKNTMPVVELCEGFKTVVYEQELLSRCDILVLTDSNFGYNAAFKRGRSDGLFKYIAKLDTIKTVNVSGIRDTWQ